MGEEGRPCGFAPERASTPARSRTGRGRGPGRGHPDRRRRGRGAARRLAPRALRVVQLGGAAIRWRSAPRRRVSASGGRAVVVLPDRRRRRPERRLPHRRRGELGAGVLGRSSPGYSQAQTVFFTGAGLHRLRAADLRGRAVLLPADQMVYIDLGFYDELAAGSAPGRAFAEAYVIAHEYGHHVQHLLGTDGRSATTARRRRLGAPRAAGRLLRRGVGGQRRDTGFIEDLTARTSPTASTPRRHRRRPIQQATGQVNPESWTHGSAERQRWFHRLPSGRPSRCDTFAAERCSAREDRNARV